MIWSLFVFFGFLWLVLCVFVLCFCFVEGCLVSVFFLYCFYFL